MHYDELSSKQKNHVNGVLARFMDDYVRNHLIWTPEQMYIALYRKIDAQHKSGWYGAKQCVNGEWIFPYYEGNSWITSDDARVYILDKFEKKYIKNKKLARKESPVIERARFGLRWNPQLFYDINWGLQKGHSFQKTELVESNDMIPWSIEHVEHELMNKYGENLRTVLQGLCERPIEKLFYEEWLSLYSGDKSNPALIPEFCGTRKMFYCYEDVRGQYSLGFSDDCKSVNIRYDFAVINYPKQTKLLIELDGHEYHKTKDQRINDSVKRAIATNEGWQLNVVTGTQIHKDVQGVFRTMDSFFRFE